MVYLNNCLCVLLEDQNHLIIKLLVKNYSFIFNYTFTLREKKGDILRYETSISERSSYFYFFFGILDQQKKKDIYIYTQQNIAIRLVVKKIQYVEQLIKRNHFFVSYSYYIWKNLYTDIHTHNGCR